jgi:ribosome-associated protein
MPVFLHNIEHELEEKFVTAGGPGGQNVNKVATAVQLRFNPGASFAFTDEEKSRIRRALASRTNAEGEIVLFVQTHRSQARNREEARARLVEMLEKALRRPKKRVATRPTRASRERRLQSKSRRSDIKRSRGKVAED